MINDGEAMCAWRRRLISRVSTVARYVYVGKHKYRADMAGGIRRRSAAIDYFDVHSASMAARKNTIVCCVVRRTIRRNAFLEENTDEK